MHDLWPASGHVHLRRDARGWLVPTDDYLRGYLALPELALLAESCAEEIALHAQLLAAPRRPVAHTDLEAIVDADARFNYGLFVSFRDAVLGAGTLEAYYLALMRSGQVTVAPQFVERIVQAIVQELLDGVDDAFEARAAELLFRPQRLTLRDGRVLCADLAAIDLLNDSAGAGDLGRLLLRNGAALPVPQLAVLGPGNAADYWRDGERYRLVLDLTHEVDDEFAAGLRFTLTRTHSGLTALARVLQKWTAHLLGVQVRITPERAVADPAWRWHVGLDTESMAILNELYEGRGVAADRLRRLVGLFRLEFANPAEMRADVAGKPVYLGLAMAADDTLKLKPQNLLLNLPLASTW
jgi:hypothetical protein